MVESSDYKEVIERKAERFDNIKKGQHRRDFVFSFLPLKKGLYTIKLDAFYKAKYNSSPNQVSEEKKENMVTSLKFEEPFDITEVFVTEDKVNSIVRLYFNSSDISASDPAFDSEQISWLVAQILDEFWKLAVSIKIYQCTFCDK